MTPRKDQRKVNGHTGPQDRSNGVGPGRAGVNGHGPVSTERGGVPVLMDRAASDDVGAIVAGDACSPTALDTVRRASTAAAPARPVGDLHGAAKATPDPGSEKTRIPGGEFSLPLDPGEFVDEIHRRADLFEVWQSLLNHGDPRIQQRAVEKLTEMRYKGAAALADEPRRIVIDIPRPDRD